MDWSRVESSVRDARSDRADLERLSILSTVFQLGTSPRLSADARTRSQKWDQAVVDLSSWDLDAFVGLRPISPTTFGATEGASPLQYRHSDTDITDSPLGIFIADTWERTGTDNRESGIFCIGGVRGSGKSQLLGLLRDDGFHRAGARARGRRQDRTPLVVGFDLGLDFDEDIFQRDLLVEVRKAVDERVTKETPSPIWQLARLTNWCHTNIVWACAMALVLALFPYYVAVETDFSPANIDQQVCLQGALACERRLEVTTDDLVGVTCRPRMLCLHEIYAALQLFKQTAQLTPVLGPFVDEVLYILLILMTAILVGSAQHLNVLDYRHGSRRPGTIVILGICLVALVALIWQGVSLWMSVTPLLGPFTNEVLFVLLVIVTVISVGSAQHLNVLDQRYGSRRFRTIVALSVALAALIATVWQGMSLWLSHESALASPLAPSSSPTEVGLFPIARTFEWLVPPFLALLLCLLTSIFWSRSWTLLFSANRLVSRLGREQKGLPVEVPVGIAMLSQIFPRRHESSLEDTTGPFLEEPFKTLLGQCVEVYGQTLLVIDDVDVLPSESYHRVMRLLRPVTKVDGVKCFMAVPLYFLPAYRSTELNDLHSSVREFYVMGSDELFEDADGEIRIRGGVTQDDLHNYLLRLMGTRIDPAIEQVTNDQLSASWTFEVLRRAWKLSSAFGSEEPLTDDQRTILTGVGTSRREILRLSQRLLDGASLHDVAATARRSGQVLERARADFLANEQILSQSEAEAGV